MTHKSKRKKFLSNLNKRVLAILTIAALLTSMLLVNLSQLKNVFADACPAAYPAFIISEGTCIRYATSKFAETNTLNAYDVAVDSGDNVYMIVNGFSGDQLLVYTVGNYNSPSSYSFPFGASGPRDIAVDYNGNVFVANSSDNITIFPAGNFSSPTNYPIDGASSSPVSIGVDSLGNVIVANQGSDDINVFPAANLNAPVRYPLPGGSFTPYDLFVAPNGDAYTANGNSDDYTRYSVADYTTPVSHYMDSINNPSTISVDLFTSHVYVGDQNVDTIEHFDSNGNYIDSYSNGTGTATTDIAILNDYLYASVSHSQGMIARIHLGPAITLNFDVPFTGSSHTFLGIAVNSAGNIFLANSNAGNTNEVPFYLLTKDELIPDPACPTVSPPYEINGGVCERYLNPNVLNTGEPGGTRAVFVDAAGVIYNTNEATFPTFNNASITVMAPPGYAPSTYLLANPGATPLDVYHDANGTYVASSYSGDSMSYFDNSFNATDYILPFGSATPYSIHGDSLGNIYTANYGSNDITVFPVGDFSNPVSYLVDGGSHTPYSITVDANDFIYTVNTDSTFTVFDPADPNNQQTYFFPSGPNAYGNGPSGIALDSLGNIYVPSTDTGVYGYVQFSLTNPSFPFSYDGGQFHPTPYGYYPTQISIDADDNLFLAGSGGVIRVIQGVNPVYQFFSYSSGSGIDDVFVDSNKNIYATGYNPEVNMFTYDFITLGQPSTATLTSMNNPESVGNNVLFTVSISGGFGTPTGNVDLYDGATLIDTQPLDGFGNVDFNITTLTAGTHNMHAFYQGDGTYAAANSNTVFQVITGTGGLIPTDCYSFTITPSPEFVFNPFTIGGQVYEQGGGPVTTGGTANIFIDTYDLGPFSLDGTGNVSYTSSTIIAGGHTVFIHYNGDDGIHLPCDSGYPYFPIYPAVTQLTLASSLNPSLVGNNVTLTATITTPYGGPWPVPQGTITFKEKGVVLGSDFVDGSGEATLVVNLPAGIHNIRAYFEDFFPNNPIDGTQMWRYTQSETLFQQVNDNAVSPTPPPPPPNPGPIGTSDFNTIIVGKDDLTGSPTQTKVNSILDWTVNYNNLGPNANPANIYFPIKENQQFVLGSLEAPAGWQIGYSTDFICDDSSFTYIPSGANGTLDPSIKCIRFANAEINSPATRSETKFITSSSDVGAINVGALGGTDVWKVMVNENKLYYFNHHTGVGPEQINPLKLLFCFDIEINDTCVSNNPNIVYPVVLGQDGLYPDGYYYFKTSNQATAVFIDGKMYFPFSDSSYISGHGLMCWDTTLDYYCTTDGFNSHGQVLLNNVAYGGWGFGNNFDSQYNPTLQEIYTATVVNPGEMAVTCFSLITNLPCPGQPYSTGNGGYDPQVVHLQYHNGRIYMAAYDWIGCINATTKAVCSDFPFASATKVTPNAVGDSLLVLYNQLCAYVISNVQSENGIYCYDDTLTTWTKHFVSSLPTTRIASYDATQNMPGRVYLTDRFVHPPEDHTLWCLDTATEDVCPGWEGGKDAPQLDDRNYGFTFAFGCLWLATDHGNVFPMDPDTGGVCNPTFTQSNGSSSVRMDATDISCTVPDSDITWNVARVLDGGTTPSPVFLIGTIYDSTQCTLQGNGNYNCTGVPLQTANLLLNSNHSMDISGISYALHPSLVFVLSFQYPSVPSPAPSFYVELNPSTQADMCAQTKLVFTGAICANPITNVCEASNIAFINDPISSNNTSQYCLNVETYFGKDPNSSLCFVDTTGTSVFKVTNENAVVAPAGEEAPVVTPENFGQGGDGTGTGVGPGGNNGGFFGNFFSGLSNTVSEETLRQVITSVNVQTPLAITAVTAATVATVIGTSVLTTTTNLGQIVALFVGFFSARRRKYWGIVIDEITNKPVPFASITLTKKELEKDNQVHTKVISQTVTDLDGRYRLNTTQRDNFFLEVRASGYQVYYKFVRMDNPLASSEDIVYDIALKRLDISINPIKNFLSYQKTRLFNILKNITLISAIIGFIATIYTQFSDPSILNLALIGLYSIMFITTIYPKIYAFILKKGYIIDKEIRSRVGGAVVRIYDSRQQIALSLSNSKGEVRFDLQPGDYSILASKRNYEMLTQEGQGKQKLLKAKVLKEGYLDRNILLKRVAESDTKDENKEGILENPFG